MKYVRTKDGIYELMFPDKEWEISFGHRIIEPAYYSIAHEWVAKKDVINQADSIEELCDEFVFVDEFGKKDLLDDDYKAKLQESGTFSVVHALMEQDRPKELYGAIWTDWGLKYVAKLNDKGELELL